MGVCPAAAVVVVGRQLVARTRFGGGEGRSVWESGRYFVTLVLVLYVVVY